MSKQLLNKTALITGASHGIGMEIGRKFLLAGANVVFSDYTKFDLENLSQYLALSYLERLQISGLDGDI